MQGDIAAQNTCAVVTAANTQLAGGGGVDGVIHRAAGLELLRAPSGPSGAAPPARRSSRPPFFWNGRGYGRSFAPPCPIWRGGHSGEAELLAGAYCRSLELAVQAGCDSVAFPAISTEVYGYPLPGAARVSVAAIGRFLEAHPALQVRLVLYDRETADVFRRGSSESN